MQFDDPDLIRLAEAAQLIPRHPATISRWTKIGIGGVRLKSLDVGGVTVTSRAALQDFFDAVTAAKKNRRDPTTTAAARSVSQ
ncbi:MAG: DUF1580 domain-containing protein [Planctomycetes bacterium]|nr:DUF1580 domain-containing protein [Planctomycetota bacterium]